MDFWPCTLVILSSRTVLGEPSTLAERTSRRGLIRGPESGVVGGRNHRRCTLAILTTRYGIGGAVVAVGGESRGLIEAFQGPRSRGGNRGSHREELATIEIQRDCPR